MLIKKLSDIDFTSPMIITFEATVSDIVSDGDGDKKPAKINVRLEESGESVMIYTWKFTNLQEYKRLVETDEILTIEAQAGTFSSYGTQIRAGSISLSGKRSSKKVLRYINIESIKNEIREIIKNNIDKDSIYFKLLQKLVLTNEKFWQWPAATRIHHALPGGLAKHSLNVCKNVISMWSTYNGSNLDKELLITGSLLHDLGKIKEYNQDGTRTMYGNFIPHSVEGYKDIYLAANELGIPENNIKLIALLHLVLSHHGKLEFGASTTPYIAEAVLVSKADDLDAVYDSMDKALSNIQPGSETDRIITLDGCKISKWLNS